MNRVPSQSTSQISWSESGAPPEIPAGDGLMLIRDYTNPNGVTIFSVKNRKMYSGIPVNLAMVELK